ncbi:MAG: sigma-70 family RNA polymerase sigma factor [Clostridia bacterium]|nr:sigma-70 family RNA polymerase sigma factor [Clostridia bacterium]
MENYASYSDERLAVLAKTDAAALETLLARYKKAVKSTARQYFLAVGEEDDLIQEGTIGLFRAINTYDGVSAFKNYAFTCIKSGIISAVRKSTSGKNKPLLYYVPIYVGEDEDKNSLIKGEIVDPEEEYINSEAAKEFMERIKAALSGYEYQILTLYLDGYSYADIAKLKGKNAKSVDNAVQRIRKKIAKVK